MNTLQIMYIEDNPGDVLLLEDALKETGLSFSLKCLHNGKEALDYFLTTEYSSLPHLILLDINLPFKSGLEVLKHLKQLDKTPEIPVVILTSSTLDQDKQVAQKLGITEFLCKPLNDLELLDLFSRVFPVMKTA